MHTIYQEKKTMPCIEINVVDMAAQNDLKPIKRNCAPKADEGVENAKSIYLIKNDKEIVGLQCIMHLHLHLFASSRKCTHDTPFFLCSLLSCLFESIVLCIHQPSPHIFPFYVAVCLRRPLSTEIFIGFLDFPLLPDFWKEPINSTHFIMQICVDRIWIRTWERAKPKKSIEKRVWHRTCHWPFSIGIHLSKLMSAIFNAQYFLPIPDFFPLFYASYLIARLARIAMTIANEKIFFLFPLAIRFIWMNCKWNKNHMILNYFVCKDLKRMWLSTVKTNARYGYLTVVTIDPTYLAFILIFGMNSFKSFNFWNTSRLFVKKNRINVVAREL